MDTTSTQLDFKEILFQQLKIGFNWRVDFDHGPHGPERELEYVIARIRGYVWNEELGQHVVTYPKDWWEALKLRFGPKWFLRRWPVDYAEVWLRATALYPDFRRPPELGKPVLRLAVFDRPLSKPRRKKA